MSAKMMPEPCIERYEKAKSAAYAALLAFPFIRCKFVFIFRLQIPIVGADALGGPAAKGSVFAIIFGEFVGAYLRAAEGVGPYDCECNGATN